MAGSQPVTLLSGKEQRKYIHPHGRDCGPLRLYTSAMSTSSLLSMQGLVGEEVEDRLTPLVSVSIH